MLPGWRRQNTYESIKNESHRFHFDDAALQTFLQGNKIFVGSFSKTSETAYKKSKCHRFIKINRCPTNAAHAILRHIRNSIAHGRISYSRKNILKLEDYNMKSNLTTMKATISQDLLISLIEKIKNTDTDTFKAKKFTYEEIEASGFNLDLCGYQTKKDIILSPEETILNFKIKRDELNKKIDEQLAIILKLLEEE